MPKPSKMTRKIPDVMSPQPTIPMERYKSLLVQVCGWRIVLRELLEYLTERVPELTEDLEMSLAMVERIEGKLARVAIENYPSIELPNTCIHRSPPIE